MWCYEQIIDLYVTTYLANWFSTLKNCSQFIIVYLKIEAITTLFFVVFLINPQALEQNKYIKKAMFYSLLVILFFVGNVFGNSVHRRIIRQTEVVSCQTPDKQPGICTNIKKCSYLYDILKSIRALQPENRLFLQQSHCGEDADSSVKVCCNPNVKSPFVVPSSHRSGLLSSTTSRATNNNDDRDDEDGPPVAKDYSVCGKSIRNAVKIVGGYNSSLGDWPWVVAMGYRQNSNGPLSWRCGGTIISDRWIITAAHCVLNTGKLNLTTVRVGDLNLDENVDDGAKEWNIPVDKIVPHPQYTVSPITNDVALVRLKYPIVFTEIIRPICILTKDEHKGETFYANKAPFIAGWGATEWRGQTSDALREAQVYIVEQTECLEAYNSQKSALIDSRVLCAAKTGKDSCQGDSGGPLMMPVGASYYIIGIVSFGIRCADLSFPGVYTKVAHYSDWIRTTAGLKY